MSTGSPAPWEVSSYSSATLKRSWGSSSLISARLPGSYPSPSPSLSMSFLLHEVCLPLSSLSLSLFLLLSPLLLSFHLSLLLPPLTPILLYPSFQAPSLSLSVSLFFSLPFTLPPSLFVLAPIQYLDGWHLWPRTLPFLLILYLNLLVHPLEPHYFRNWCCFLHVLWAEYRLTLGVRNYKAYFIACF